MFWIFVWLFSIFLLVLGWHKKWEAVDILVSVLSVVLPVILFIFVVAGYTTYPDLLKERQEVITLQKNVSNVKNSIYKEKSLEFKNFAQSTNLSKFLILLAKEKAEYNKDLTEAKFYKTNFLSKFFGYGLFISNRVLKLESIY